MKVLGYLYEKEVDSKGGTWFRCYVPQGINHRMLERYKCDDGLWEMDMKIHDPKVISNKQQKLLYALFKDISLHTGYEVKELKELMKIEFMVDKDRDYFSLSNVEMEIATEFIEYVLEFMFAWDIPINKKVVVLAREVNNFLYLCLIHRKCAVCGSHADIHHHSNLVGMGRDRNRHDHHNSEFIALCRTHHTECHQIGLKQFEQKYHLKAIKLDLETIKELGI